MTALKVSGFMQIPYSRSKLDLYLNTAGLSIDPINVLQVKMAYCSWKHQILTLPKSKQPILVSSQVGNE